MQRILVVTDVPWVRNATHAALTEPDYELTDLDDASVAGATAIESGFDVVVTDLQVGSMGGMAITRDVRERSGLSGRSHLPVVLLLDRAADSFLAKRAGAASWLVKPFTAHEMRAAVVTAISAEPAGT